MTISVQREPERSARSDDEQAREEIRKLFARYRRLAHPEKAAQPEERTAARSEPGTPPRGRSRPVGE
jgi:hypothetical protein